MRGTTFTEDDVRLDRYQAWARQVAIYPDVGNNLIYPALGLAGEAGEFCNKVKKVQRDHGGVLTEEMRDSLAKELGDVLWYLAACAWEIRYSLVKIAIMNLKVLFSRKDRGVLKGDGDER